MIEQIIIKIIKSLPEIILIFGIYLLFSRIIFITKSRKVFGEVSGIEARQTDSPMGVSSVAGHRRAVFYPKIFYKDDNGRQHRLIVGQVAKFLSYNTGDKVSVIYSSFKPSKAFLNNIYCVWVTPISYFCLGVALIIYKYIIY